MSGELRDLALARSALDRVGPRRTDAAWLAAAWADPRTRVLAVGDGRVPVAGDPPGLVLTGPEAAPGGERYLLGVDRHGVAFFAVRTAKPAALEGARPAGLREVGALLSARDAGLLTHAVALANWHVAHTHCSRCGAPTVVEAAGHLRRCPADRSEHFPRTDPAVIMAIVDRGERLLLGRQAAWPERRYSTLAGFVEPGESVEAAVRREVAEEAGVVVGEVSYLGSQPWPFPSSLMLGFVGRAETTALTLADHELVEARWVTRSALAADLAAGELLLPPRVSIARRLVEHWYGGPLDPPDP